MADLEIPLGKRTLKYRLLEMLPATLSYGALALLVILSLIDPLYAAVYLMFVVITLIVKAVGIAVHTIRGNSNLLEAQKVDWHERFTQLSDPAFFYRKFEDDNRKEFHWNSHVENLKLVAAAPDSFPRPDDIYHAVIIATYNEAYDVLRPTIESVRDTAFDNKKLIVVLAYEERGGEQTEKTAHRLAEEFKDTFLTFQIVKHPQDLPEEIKGKGGNISYAGKFLSKWLTDHKISSKDTIVTTLDSDNRPHRHYFDYVAYEFITREDRKRLSYQPISLFTNNIWDVPAPMRVIATGNSFWNIISSMRPHTLRNFASHSQPMDALEEMNFWSRRTIVEDGHQYWRSYFYFAGNYSVVPIHVPIYQDAVLSDTYGKTLKAQFIQLRRWAYGASDVAYVANNIFSKKRSVPLGDSILKLIRLVDGHVTLASVSFLVAFGGWVPLLVNGEAARSMSAHQLPDTIAIIQTIAMIGLLITIFLSFKLLPPRPVRYKKHRTAWMVAQWVLMPVTAVVYTASSALYSQARLFLGLYLGFDVTEKTTIQDIDKAKELKSKKH
jgi:cellulose synthase/poly-beta-1,6-N-acetylglucosamine synthase-like glycosyltransferase